MFRKLTAIFLLSLMVAASATSQLGVKYCLCFHSVFVDQCPCLHESSATPDCESQEDHCGCDCESEEQESPDKSFQPRDCTVALAIKLDDCTTPSADDSSRKKNPSLDSTSLPAQAKEHQPASLAHRVHEARGSPPPQLAVRPLPLFIRHSSFLV